MPTSPARVCHHHHRNTPGGRSFHSTCCRQPAAGRRSQLRPWAAVNGWTCACVGALAARNCSVSPTLACRAAWCWAEMGRSIAGAHKSISSDAAGARWLRCCCRCKSSDRSRFLRTGRRPNVPALPVPMRRLSSSPWRPLLHSVASAPPRRWQSALVVRRGAPRIVAPSPPARRVSRFPHGTRNMAGSSSGYERTSDDKERGAADPIDDDDVALEEILPDSSHRDGTIYSVMHHWKNLYRIADRNETYEAMRFSDPTDCHIRNGTCMLHTTCHMLQIFSLKLAKIPMERGPVELYGYIATRDRMDPLLNYVVNFSRDDPIIVEQGSLINMAGPKRGIPVINTTLIEYDMKIKTGQHEKEDLQLIDGVSLVDNSTWHTPCTSRLHGGYGGIDMTVGRLYFAVEATIQVAVAQVRGGFSMRLGCFTSGLDEEILLFDGAIGEPRALRRSVVAVVKGAQMDLKMKVAAGSCVPAEHCCSFEAKKHGRAAQEVKTDSALITVNVTRSTLC